MRITRLKVVASALMLQLLVGIVPSAMAQTATPIFGYNKDWKYNQDGVALSADWNTAAYNDAAWPSGTGALGYPSDENLLGLATVSTALSRYIPGSTTTQVQTYYFRTRFNYSGPTSGVTLVFSNLLDDGAVVYLNGVEAGRAGMPAGAVTYSTGASRGDEIADAAHGVDRISFVPSNLIQGQNLIAVELHQTGSPSTSSDAIFAMSLTTIVPTAVSITTQPQSQTIQLGSPVTFSVGVSGGPASYQWQKDTVNINGATNATYTIGSVTAASAGSYRVRVFNSVNSVTSAPPAVLTVVSDTEPPELLTAVVREVTSGVPPNTILTFTNIDITVDENLVGSTATSTNNYKVYRSDTGALVPVVSAVFNFPTIRLSVATNTGTWFYRSNYFVRASGLTDTRGNVMPATDIGVSWRVSTNLMQMSQAWDFFNLSFIFDPNFVIYSNFFRTNFVVDYNQGWGNGLGILWNDQDQSPPTCGTGNTLGADCGFQNDPQYFRRTFQAPAGLPSSGTLRLQYVIDDGAVFYFNGLEIHRYNMPAGGLTPASKASANINPAVCVTNVAVNITNRMNVGNNWMAVTVYQSTGDGEADTVMGLSMDFETLQTGPVPPKISISRSGSVVQVRWTGTGYSLQSSMNPANAASWANVAGATSPATAVPNTFYRLRKN